MQKFTLTALCSALALAAAMPSSAKDGVYTAEALGRNGQVVVQTTIQDGRIQDVKVVDWSETHPIADLPRTKIPADIVKYQTTNVDVVSGETLTSFAIRAAVRDCVKQAGLDVVAFSKAAPKQPLETGHVEETADVVVIGAGGAGLSAALEAAKAGQRVIVLEKTHYAGGNTSVAGGCYNAADPVLEAKEPMTAGRRAMIESILDEKPRNALHKELLEKLRSQFADYNAKKETGVFDSIELHALQSWRAGDYEGDLSLVYRLAQESPKMQKELAAMGFQWKDRTVQAVGALWPRSNRAVNYKSGVGFIDTFLGEIKAKHLPVEFLMNTRATDLIVKDGRVVGVKAVHDGGKTYTVMGKNGVILTTGGFGANVEMRQKYDTTWDKKLDDKVMTSNLNSITGDGIVMAEKVNAELIQMGYIQLLPTTDPYTGATNTAVGSSTGIYVNKNGKRFVNEMGRRDELSRAALAQPDHKFFILATGDVNMIDKNGRNQYGIKVDDLIAQKKVFKADSWDELGDCSPSKLTLGRGFLLLRRQPGMPGLTPAPQAFARDFTREGRPARSPSTFLCPPPSGSPQRSRPDRGAHRISGTSTIVPTDRAHPV